MTTERQIALFRGINVGLAKRVAMEDLRKLIGSLGYADVRTLLNSGNVVFAGAGEEPAVAANRIEEALIAKLGVGARVTVFGAATLAEIVADNPLCGRADDPARLLVAVLIDPARRSLLEALSRRDWAPDAYALGRHAAYLWCPDGILASRAAEALGKLLGDGVTTRNWATIGKLHSLACGEAG